MATVTHFLIKLCPDLSGHPQVFVVPLSPRGSAVQGALPAAISSLGTFASTVCPACGGAVWAALETMVRMQNSVLSPKIHVLKERADEGQREKGC